MSSPLSLVLNGQPHSFPGLSEGSTLQELVVALELQGDRVAVEHNGEIVPRTQWEDVKLATGDKLEVVHFVGGGTVN